MTDLQDLVWPNGDKTLAETLGDWFSAQRSRTEIGLSLTSEIQIGLGMQAGDWARLGEILNFFAIELTTLVGAVALIATEVDRQAGRTNGDLHGKYPFLYG